MDESPKIAKPLFSETSLPYYQDEHILGIISKTADVQVMLKMIEGKKVRRADALKVLAAFSAYTKETWDLNNVQVALMPTFAELHAIHQFDLASLANGAIVPIATINMMLAGQPVTQRDASLVLQAASNLANEHLTIESVDVPLIEEEKQHE